MTGPSEVDPAVLAGDPGSAQQLERGDDDLSVLGQDPDEGPSDEATDEGWPAEPGESHQRGTGAARASPPGRGVRTAGSTPR